MTDDQKREVETELNKAYTAFLGAMIRAGASERIVKSLEESWRYVCRRLWQ